MLFYICRKKYFILLCGFVFAKFQAQEKLGMSNSNYMPTYGLYLNPSSTVDSWTYQQINLVGINAYFMNNIAYLPKFSMWQFAKAQDLGAFKSSNIKLKQFLYATGELAGPSYLISRGLLSGGLYVRGRTALNLTNVPYKLTNMLINQDFTGPKSGDLNQKNLRFSNMSWIEYGLNFGGIIKRDKFTLITLAGNLKYNSGINIAYGNLERLIGYYNDSLASIQTLRGKVRYNDGKFNSGKGFGLDLGFTYKKMLGTIRNYFSNSPKSNCKFVDYKYKLGISLRDMGYIRFNGNTTKLDVDGSGMLSSLSSNNYVNTLKDKFSISTTTGKPIMASLPLSASLQFDYNFENNIFINITAIKNLVPNALVGVQGANLVSVCPRFEMKQVTVAIPLTFQRFIYPQLGFAARYRSFVLGFDNVFPLIIKKNTYGVGIYCSLAVSLFTNNECARFSNGVDNCPPLLKIFKPKLKKKKRKYLTS